MVELVVTLAVFGLLAAVAVPALRDFLAAQAVDAHANELAASLRAARSEALKRGYEVTVCAGGGGSCSGSTDWDNGWVTFVDNSTGATFSANGALDANDKVLRVQDKTRGTGLIVSSVQSVTMGRSGILLFMNGAAVAAGSVASIVVKPLNGPDAKARSVCVNKQGRVSVFPGVVSTC